MIDKLYESRLNGIFCQTLDRWILVDDKDFWVTFETAKVLSSKVATTVYVLPSIYADIITPENCCLWSILDKTAEKRDGVPDVIVSQMPTLRLFRETNAIYEAGSPKDFSDPEGKLFVGRLLSFVAYVQRILYAVEISNALVSHKNFMQFSREFFSEEMTTDLSAFNSAAKADIDFRTEVKRILYHADDIFDASVKINRAIFNKEFSKDRALLDLFYELSRE